MASIQVTDSTGQLSPQAAKVEGLLPIRAFQSACVTSVVEMQKSRVSVTLC